MRDDVHAASELWRTRREQQQLSMLGCEVAAQLVGYGFCSVC